MTQSPPPRSPLPLVACPRTEALPLSFAQQRLWFIEQLEPGGASYHVRFCVRLQGRVDPAALRRALQRTVDRHEALRTSFQVVAGQPRQVIADAVEVPLSVESVESLPAHERLAEAQARARREAVRPFDLARGPMLRAKLLRLSDDEHLLLLVLHHAICDDWSVGVLVHELGVEYRALVHGEPSPLPPLAVQYADYAVWQRSWVASPALAPHLDYWRRQLAGTPAALDLPTDRPRPAVRSVRGAWAPVVLPRALVSALGELGRQERVTLYMTLLAAFDTLLWRYTGQQDIVVGSPIAGRNRRELEELIGFFAGTLVLRVGVDGDLSFRQLVQRVRKVCLDAYAHQDVPFEQLVDELKLERDLSRTPLFQVMFVLRNTPAARVALGDAVLEPVVLDVGTAAFDLTVFLQERDGEVTGWIEYSTDLFDAATMARMTRHYRALLEAVVERPDARLRAVPMLGEAERHQILDAWNHTTPTTAASSVVALCAAQLQRTPDAVALCAGDVQLSYRALDAQAAAWAAVLRARGCGRDARVALALARGPAFPVLALAVLKAGAAYVPLDPSYPAERLAFMLQDCGARVLVTEAALADRLPANAAEVLLVDEPPPTKPPAPGEPPAADDLAYVIYTSGSTGRPKGVAMPHGAVANLVRWQCDQWTAPARTLQFASPSFDVSFQELFATWASGGCLVVADEEVRRDPAELLRVCKDQQIERLFVPFVALHQLAEVAQGRDLAGLALREIITAGEQLRITPAVAALFTRLPRCRLYNQYGPTETHVATEHALVGEPGSWDALPPIGRPIAGARAYVLDDDRQPTPIGVPGELYLAGAGVARGYLGRPELTEQRFVPDPFGAPGTRMYRTGDRAKYLATGELVFLGRSDDQVKIRGYRIELAEIEAALGTHPAVNAAAVVARRDGDASAQLIAYVAAADATAATLAALQHHLRARLPDYMVPAVIAILPALPLSPNGKVDRKALPRPEATRAVRAAAPRTAMEEVVAQVWEPLLGVASLGATESFFDVGGHSLLATQVIARLGAALGVELSVRTLFEAPTLGEFARRLEAATRTPAPLTEIAPTERGAALQLSFAQQRLWFLEQLAPGGFAYNVPWFQRLSGPLDVATLERSVNALVQRHEILRTRFVEVHGEPRPVIVDALHVALDVEPALEHDVAELALRAARQPFDLARGPLIRARLLQLSDREHVLLVVMHHIACDGWSVEILARELGAVYTAIVAGAAPALPALPVQYVDFAQWQRQRLTGAALDAQLAYWTRVLADAPPTLDLPTDRPRPPVRTPHGAVVTRALGRELGAAVRALSRSEGASELMTLLAAFTALLARYSGQRDLVVGTPISGRNRAEIEGLVGFFVNTLALRVDVDGALSFRALVQQVRDACLNAYAHQDAPFDKLVDVLRPDRARSRTPLFQVMFALQGAAPAPAVAGLSASHLDLHPGMAKFDLTLLVRLAPDGLVTTWEYSTDLFDASTIERMADHYGCLLEGAVAHPARRVEDLPLLSRAAHAQLLARGEVRSDFPADDTLPALFAAQLARTPDALAVVAGEVRLSYAQLDARTNQLARLLRARGVAREDRVGLCLGRSVDFVVAVLATLKAGAAYVPLDPSYPPDRLAFMAADAGVRLVLARDRHASAPLSSPTVWLDDVRELEALSDAPLPGVATSRDLAYVMYTSGSTGQPKGTCIDHRAIARLVLATDYLQLGPLDVVAHLSNTSFDAATFEIWGALLTGASLFVIPPDVVLSPDALGDALALGRVTAMFVTTALFHQLAQSSPAIFRRLHHLLFGGESLDANAVRRVLYAGPPRRLLHVYGPTETTTFATWQLVDAVDPLATTLPIGRPIANTTVRILDPRGQLVPVGVRGELHIGGPGLARGYWNRPDLTAERFIADPFDPAARLYRTGDLAAWRPDGSIDFHGRADHQVKLRGFRIELGEIEAHLLAAPAVAAAAVLVRHDTGDPRLVAYVVPTAALDTESLRLHLAAALPGYMIPSAFVLLERLPLTPNGKLDRRALPPPSLQRDAVVPARSAMEEIVGGIWEQLLQVDAVNPTDNFFALGGHSLLVMQMLSKLRGEIGSSISVSTLFDAPTLAAFARQVQVSLEHGPSPLGSVAPLEPMPRSEQLPLLSAQRRLWFLDRLAPGGSAYNVPLVARLIGPLQIDLLARCLHELVRRHEVLRTRFVDRGGEPVQVIDPAGDAAQLLVAEALHPGDDVEAWSQREARRPFALADEPPLRAKLLIVAPDHHVLMLAMHHIACDEASVGILMRELQALYRAQLDGQDAALPRLTVQCADVAIWQRDPGRDALHAHQLAYWKAQLAAAPDRLELPTDRPRPAVQTARGAMLHRELSPAVTAAARALSKRCGTTLFMTLLAGYYALLHRYSGQAEVVVGAPIAGRQQPALEDLIGFFVNTLALRVRIDEDASFLALLASVRDTCLRAYAHQDVPFERVVDAVHPARDPSRTPLFQVMFALQHAPVSLALPGLAVDSLYVHPGIAKVDLTLYIEDAGEQLRAHWEYNTDLFDAATVQRIAAHHAALLEQLIAEPAQRISSAPLVAGAEQAQLLAHGAVRTDYPADATLPALFAAQVVRTPDAPAVVFGEVRLSYAELDARADRLARLLRARGVAPQDRVGICLGRSIDFVVAVLATLKAGAAYVPLDPSYPADRLAFMAHDAGARVVLARDRLAGGAILPGTVWLDDVAPELARMSDAHLPGVATSRDLAYVMYTSGSTGQPKGTCIDHRAIARLVLGTDYLQLARHDVVAHLSNTSFDAATFEIWGALLNGATLVGIAPDVVLSPDALGRALTDGRVTAMFLTTALFHQLAATTPAIFRSLDHVLFGGESLDANAVRRVLAAGPPRRLLHVYGPTETTTFATWQLVDRVDDGATTLPIGRPIANTTVRILDPHGQLVPIGVRGELHIGGPGLARGYWNRPDLTSERFIADPFAPGERLYRTGDLAAWRSDGAIEFLGRADHQIKLRGFRIELGEIEAQLLAVPAVAAAAVVVRHDTGDPRLVAYVVPTAGAALDPHALRAHLAAVLPGYMVPGAFVRLDRLPLTPNGKIDRRALPATPLHRDEHGADYVAPEGDLARAVSQIWAEVLGVDRIGAHDNFFDLGGNSLLLTTVRSRLEALLGRAVPIVDLFQHAQVQSLSAHLAGLGASPGADLRPLSPEPARAGHRAAGARRLADQRRGRPTKP